MTDQLDTAKVIDGLHHVYRQIRMEYPVSGEFILRAITRLRAADAATAAAVGWQDISTAPRDGTTVLTYGSLHDDKAPYGIGETPTVKISQFVPEHGFWCCDAWGSHQPVFWQPLPAPPALPTPSSGEE